MTKYNVYIDDDNPLQYLISGGHFSEEKTLEILISKKVIDKSDNLAICDIDYGYGRKTTDDDMIEGVDPYPFTYQQGLENIPPGYNVKTTFVELYEPEE